MSMPIVMRGETYLDTNETCTRLGVSRETLRKYVHDKRLQQYRKGIARPVYYKQIEVENLARELSDIRPVDEDE